MMKFLKQPRVHRYLLGQLFDALSSGMIMLALPWLMLKQGDNGTAVALVSLVCTVSFFVLTPFISTLIDRMSRKTILVSLQVIQCVTALMLLALGLNQSIGIWELAIAQWVFWMCWDIAWLSNNAFTQENFETSEYPKISSYQEVIFQAVTLAAGALGILILERWSYQEFALFTAVLSGIGMILYSSIPYRRKLKSSSSQSFARQLLEIQTIVSRDVHFFVFLAMSCLSYPILTYLVKLVPIYLSVNRFDGHWFALWKSSYGLGALMCGFLVVLLLQKFKQELLMVSAVISMAGLLLIMSWFNQPLELIVITLVFGFFNSLNRVARVNKMNMAVDVNERGRIDGGLKMFSTLAQSLSYLLILLLANKDWIEYGFLSIAVVMLFASAYMIWYLTWQRERRFTESKI